MHSISNKWPRIVNKWLRTARRQERIARPQERTVLTPPDSRKVRKSQTNTDCHAGRGEMNDRGAHAAGVLRWRPRHRGLFMDGSSETMTNPNGRAASRNCLNRDCHTQECCRNRRAILFFVLTIEQLFQLFL